MSKQKNKDKKNDTSLLNQQQYELQKRQILENKFIITKLEEQMSNLTQDNGKLIKDRDDCRQIFNEKVEELNIRNEANQKAMSMLSKEKTKLMMGNNELQHKIKRLEKAIMEEQQGRFKEMQEYKKNIHFQISKYENQLMDYKIYMNERDELQDQRMELRQQVEVERAEKIREVADKEREKVQATDKLRDEMLKKVRDMRVNLLSLKKEQLSTTTRLTMLQNHQLTSELEYQSKQTQKMIFKNKQLQHKITQLKQQVQIQKQVQQELAKRSNFSKGIIRNLNSKVSDLETQVEQNHKKLCFIEKKESPIQIMKTDQNYQNSIHLEKQLEKYQKQYIDMIGCCDDLKKEKKVLEQSLRQINCKSTQIFRVLKQCYDEIILGQKRIGIDNTKENIDQNNVIDLNSITKKPVQDWSQKETAAITEIILKVLKPCLNKQNLLFPSVRKNINNIDNQSGKYIKPILPKLLSEREQIDKTKISSKMVKSSLKKWGKTVSSCKGTSSISLRRKFRMGDNNYRS